MAWYLGIISDVPVKHGDEGEKSCDCQCHPGRQVAGRDEEGEPRDEHEHGGREKGLGNMGGQLPLIVKSMFGQFT